jgi:GMP synthase-like glutamine amidotransferase
MRLTPNQVRVCVETQLSIDGADMKKILVLQHLDVEDPGVFLEFWENEGLQWTAVELHIGDEIPSFDGYDLLVVMGGPMDVWQEDIHPWLVREKAAIRRWVMEEGKPYLGICLGHQLLAEALLGKVGLMRAPEVGLAQVELTEEGLKDPILAGFNRQVETFQWHGAEVNSLPSGAVVLASNEACPVQAFRWGEHAYGFQYHVEITEHTVQDWESIPEYAESLRKALGAERAATLANEVRPRLASFRQSAARLNANLLALVKARSSV